MSLLSVLVFFAVEPKMYRFSTWYFSHSLVILSICLVIRFITHKLEDFYRNDKLENVFKHYRCRVEQQHIRVQTL